MQIRSRRQVRARTQVSTQEYKTITSKAQHQFRRLTREAQDAKLEVLLRNCPSKMLSRTARSAHQHPAGVHDSTPKGAYLEESEALRFVCDQHNHRRVRCEHCPELPKALSVDASRVNRSKALQLEMAAWIRTCSGNLRHARRIVGREPRRACENNRFTHRAHANSKRAEVKDGMEK